MGATLSPVAAARLSASAPPRNRRAEPPRPDPAPPPLLDSAPPLPPRPPPLPPPPETKSGEAERGGEVTTAAEHRMRGQARARKETAAVRNMAGKSKGGKNKGKAQGAGQSVSAEVELPVTDGAEVVIPENGEVTDPPAAEGGVADVEKADGDVPVAAQPPKKAAEGNILSEAGELHLYPVPVRTQSGEKLELQLSPGDSVIDVKQFLLDAPETCFYTCYDLILHTKDGSTHQLEDYNEISEIADITSGGCSLEMVAAIYDERSIRSHLRRVRELLSLSSLHVSLSTSLALQQESAQGKSAGSEKTVVQELDGLNFMEDSAGALTNLLASTPTEIKCVESIVFSSFNPPPSYRRLHGDLIYIDIGTLEGNKYCITGNSKSFYVNCSNGSVLDPKPTKQGLEASTLVGLLQKISAKFKKGFREVLDRRASAHPFENVQSLLPVTSWLGAHPVPEHRRDAARAEDSVVLSYGTELIGMQRDWNEELQSCREFPHGNPQERILRGRALYKVTCDFVDAAVKGAVGVINRCIPPINPTDPECFHMYVHNNIFFSFAVDSDYEHISKDCIPDCQNGPGRSTKVSSPDVEAKLDMNHAESTEVSQSVSDNSSDASAEAQIADSEQATYASANNDLKGTKAYQEADISGLYNLAMAIIDYRGHRVVAQSIIPGILQGDKSDSLLYGSVDNGKKISWNESFHSKVVEAAKRLHLKEHVVLDGSGNPVKLAATVECKGIVGSDDRHYILDLMRVTPRDSNYIGQEHRFCVLRPELVASFVEAESTKQSPRQKVPDAPEESSDQVASTSDAKATSVEGNGKSEECSAPAHEENDNSSAEILFNPNVFTEYKLAGSPEEITADEELVKRAGTYLLDIVIPKFVQDLCSLDISPMDGQTLTDALHLHGINVRYLGKIAGMIKHLPHLWDLFSAEIIVRMHSIVIPIHSIQIIILLNNYSCLIPSIMVDIYLYANQIVFLSLKEILRLSPDHDIGPAIALFLNCFVGKVSGASTKGSPGNAQSKTQKGHENSQTQKSSKGQKLSHTAASRKGLSTYSHLTSDGIWSSIKEFAKSKYQFEVPHDARVSAKRVSVLRNLCQKVGITIAARKYDLDASTPFQVSDILNLQPVVKHSVPTCTDAKNLMEAGKVRMAEGTLNEAYALFSEAFSLLQQVTGPMHKDAANCCRYLAMVLYHAGDTAGAIVQQHRELIINERCLGLDHPDTAHRHLLGTQYIKFFDLAHAFHCPFGGFLLSFLPISVTFFFSYGNMALFYHGLNQTELALRHMSRTLLLLSLASGPDHPDVAATLINVAMMYQDANNMNTALRYLQEALMKNERLLGPDHVQTAVCYHALAIAFSCMSLYKLSIQHEKKTYDILAKQLGENDSRTKDSENWLNTFKLREEQVNAQKQKGQGTNASDNAINFLKAHPAFLQAMKAAAIQSGDGSENVNRSLNAAVVGEGVPRLRGVDERAARATAEARKKAAARGLNVRNGPAANNASVELAQILKLINQAASASSTSATTNTQESASEGQATNGPAQNGTALEASADTNSAKSTGNTPVGLGTTLELKKQKSKQKS
ncbi:Clustered mitochondria protein [Dichanthelium oligosanthes]|uniref:Clustered mitochondria protein n=1 Tax=Dichanthelium oligosanthes TaxID=888268 RepID=A0A1E5UI15_9POAL|nr:Clustered mitochondria protein [Dichanthelium oligosanthes]